MAKAYPEINEELARFIEAQPMFFVATAPLDANGHVNVSPKGLDTFRILGPRTVAYLDIFGSGVETIAHLRENGRIVLMFCAFQGADQNFAPARPGTCGRTTRGGVRGAASSLSRL